jgi:SAM-dependent methyltransferase
MKFSLLDVLACPKCQQALEGTKGADHGDLLEGALQCRGCGASYPVRGGVPRFVDAGNYGASFGQQWNWFRTTQLDSVSRTDLSATRFFSETGWPREWLRGKLVLDAGCGAGRFLEIAAECGARVVGVDISSAVDAAAANVGRFPNAHVIQASLYELPFRRGVFDACYCIGVLQHTPDPNRALVSLAPVLKEGGRLAVVAYERKRWTKLNTKYLIRPLTRRMPKGALLKAIQVTMPVVFVITEVLYRLPVVGRMFKFVIPVANYTDEPRLSLRQRYDWAILDTLDMLSPAFDQPQTAPEVMNTLSEAGIVALQRRPTAGLTVVGTKKG